MRRSARPCRAPTRRDEPRHQRRRSPEAESDAGRAREPDGRSVAGPARTCHRRGRHRQAGVLSLGLARATDRPCEDGLGESGREALDPGLDQRSGVFVSAWRARRNVGVALERVLTFGRAGGIERRVLTDHECRCSGYLAVPGSLCGRRQVAKLPTNMNDGGPARPLRAPWNRPPQRVVELERGSRVTPDAQSRTSRAGSESGASRFALPGADRRHDVASGELLPSAQAHPGGPPCHHTHLRDVSVVSDSHAFSGRWRFGVRSTASWSHADRSARTTSTVDDLRPGHRRASACFTLRLVENQLTNFY